MTKKTEIGNLGENLACEFLENKKYRIIERNFRRKYGEIDIIARTKDGIIVFVEVKTMREINDLKPEDNLTDAKLKKIKRTASVYAGENQKLIKDKKGWRIDLIAITTLTNNLKYGDKKSYRIYHYENI